MLNVAIQSIVKNLGSHVVFLQPMFESIVNSLEANAHHITISIEESPVLDQGFVPKICGFSIEDDGDGFGEENINSFCTLWSDHKVSLGCKGSGRFTWLSVFRHILITSFLKRDKKKIEIPFSMEFSARNDIRESFCDGIDANKTIISFRGVTDAFYKSTETKIIDKREEANVDSLKQQILDYLFLKLWFLKHEGFPFEISIVSTTGHATINWSDICDLEEDSFEVLDESSGQVKTFNAKYRVSSDGLGRRDIILCSGKRSAHAVRPSSVGINDKLPNRDSLLFFVTSDYLDAIDTDDRAGLHAYASSREPNLLYPIPYNALLEAISNVVQRLILAKYPSLRENNEKIKTDLRSEKPYLSRYIDSIPVTVASKTSLEEASLKAFEKDKNETSERFENALRNRNLDPRAFDEALRKVSAISAAELCEYIIYRSKILRALSSETLARKKEEYLHDIFMPRKATSEGNDYYNTNLWLIDDKFMSYVYASSDISILGINRQLNDTVNREAHDLRRPDMFVAFNNETGSRDAILVEFKGYSADIDEKNKALTELPNNIGVIRKTNEDIRTIWAYIITKLDPTFIESINNQGYYTALGTVEEGPAAYYFYNRARNTHFYIVDIDKLVNDAKARNKVFLDILSKE